MRIKLYEILETNKAEVLAYLDLQFQDVDHTNLPAVAEQLEEELCKRLISNLVNNCDFYLQGSKASRDSKIRLRNAEYKIRVAEDLIEHEVLGVALVNETVWAERPRYRQVQVALRGIGRFKRISLYLPVGLKIDRDSFEALANSVFETGYVWLDQATRRVVRRTEAAVADILYSYLRALVPHPDVTDSVWFGAVSKGHAYYVLDEVTVASAISAIHEQESVLGKSPARLVSELLTRILPYELIHAKRAVIGGQCIDVDLRTSRYSETESIFLSAEISIFGSPSISVFPVVRDGESYLIAAFPTRFKATLKPVLEQHRQEFENRFRSSTKPLRRIFTQLQFQRRSVPYIQIGELLGGLLRGLVGEENLPH